MTLAWGTQFAQAQAYGSYRLPDGGSVAPTVMLCPGAGQTAGPCGGQGSSFRAPGTYTQTTIKLAAGTSTVLIAAHPTRKSIQAILRSATMADVCYHATAGTPCAAGAGYPLVGQYASTPIYDAAGVSIDEWDAICAAACSITVIEGN